MGRNRLDFPERSVAYLYADERGSIIAVTDSVGAVLNRTGYDEYGLFTEANSSYASRFKYTGQAYIPEMGMYYYKARMYSPTLGRFMQTDPIGYGDGANMYNYVHSDPVNGTDPSGLKDCQVTTAGADGIPYTQTGPCPGGGLATPGVHSYTFGSGGLGGWGAPPSDGGSLNPCLEWNFREYCKGNFGNATGNTTPWTDPAPANPAARRAPQNGQDTHKQNPQQKDKYACLKAVGGGALDAIIAPENLLQNIASATVASTAGYAVAARKVANTADVYKVARVLQISKVTFASAAASLVVQASVGAAWTYFTDPRCK